MVIYTFKGGMELIEIKAEPMTDLDIMCNNKLLQTGDKFVSIGKLLGEEKAKELREKLELLYENYIINEFAKMGYEMVNKDASRTGSE